MDEDALRARIARHKWFHEMVLAPGVTTPGSKDQRILATEARCVFSPLHVSGRTVLDVGAWNGFFSFEAKRRGASRVLATDSFTWRHPDYRGREALELAREALALDVETQDIDVMELPPELGAFDIVLFLGVFYHLIDPIAALARLRPLTGGVLVVETHQDALQLDRPGMIFYPGDELDSDPTNWWGPNPAAMRGLLRQAGFARVFYQDHPFCLPAGEWPRRRRGFYHAFTAQDPAPWIASQPGWIDLDNPQALASLRL